MLHGAIMASTSSNARFISWYMLSRRFPRDSMCCLALCLSLFQKPKFSSCRVNRSVARTLRSSSYLKRIWQCKATATPKSFEVCNTIDRLSLEEAMRTSRRSHLHNARGPTIEHCEYLQKENVCNCRGWLKASPLW